MRKPKKYAYFFFVLQLLYFIDIIRTVFARYNIVPKVTHGTNVNLILTHICISILSPALHRKYRYLNTFKLECSEKHHHIQVNQSSVYEESFPAIYAT